MDSEKKNSYDAWWLAKDMENMGYIFEYCVKYCRQLYGVEIDRKKFLDTFMNSNLRYEMETGHPRLLSQSAFDTVKKFIEVDNLGHIENFGRNGADPEYLPNQWYWVGWMYAYLHFRADILSADLVRLLPLDRMLEDYHLGHEMDREVYYSRKKELLGAGAE